MKKTISDAVQSPVTVTAATQGPQVDVTRARNVSAQVVVTNTGVGSIQFQKSNDGTSWVNDGSSVAVNGAGTYWMEKVDPCCKYMRISYGWTSGTFVATPTILAQGDF